MLDLSVPYVSFVMKRNPGTPIPEYNLPEGYKFKMYEPGFEKDWARIETSVLEFDDELDALLHFQKEYLADPGEAERRCIFIENDKGERIATSSAWWKYNGNRRDPCVHWVAVNPNYQGKGLGKAIVIETLRLLMEIEGDKAYYLSTQTHSHRAVFIYEWAGFHITDERNIIGKENDDYDEAIAEMNKLR
jgi:GNAT superfamily N-acetyltransferase